MPFADFEDFEECVRENSDKRDPEAFCAAIKRQIEGAAELSDADREAIREASGFSDRLLDDDPCWEGYTMVGTKVENGEVVPNCVPDDDVPDANLAAADDRCGEGKVKVGDRCVAITEVEDTPPSSLDMSKPRVMATAERLDTQPIEREELSGGEVAYRNLKLVDAGVWTDQASETPTLYDERTFENTVPEFDDSKHNGPPVNIAHDLHKDGADAGEPHEASVAGYVDPDSIRTDGRALFGDVILETSDPAGAFADENLRSALENDGTAGFSPSVELMPSDLREASHPRAEEHVAAAELTGLGLVRDPASESVDLAVETQQRSVALSAAGGASNRTDKAVVMQKAGMDPEQIRDTLDSHGIPGLDEMTDDEVMDMAESLHDDLMGELEGDAEGDGEESEMATHDGDDEEDDEEDDEDKEMMDDAAIQTINEQIDDLWDAIDEMKSEMSAALTEEELSSELEAAREELAAAETVEAVDERLRTLEEQEAGRKTLADADAAEDMDFSDAEVGIDYDPATGSTSR